MPTLNRAPNEKELQKLIAIFLRAETAIINEIGRLRSQGYADYHVVASLERVQAILRQMENDCWQYVPQLVEKQFYTAHSRRAAGREAPQGLGAALERQTEKRPFNQGLGSSPPAIREGTNQGPFLERKGEERRTDWQGWEPAAQRGNLMEPFDYHSPRWKRKRAAILRRDGYLCQECRRYGRRRQATTVHHIRHADEYPELAYTDSNLVSLCSACHQKAHPEKGAKGLASRFR